MSISFSARVNTMWVAAFLFLGVQPGVRGAGGPAVAWLPPGDVPGACAGFNVEVLLFDVSKSMKQFGLLNKVKGEAVGFLSSGMPDCSLAVVASFGMTADVLASEFMTSTESRGRLTAVVAGLRATHNYTNLDEAAKLMELVCLQLREAYGVPARSVSIRVYTDNVGDPSPGKPRFSLSRSISSRLSSEREEASVTPLAGGFRIFVEPRSITKPSGRENVLKKKDGGGGLSGLVLAAGIALAGLAAAIVARLARGRRGARAAGEWPRELLVTEVAAPADGEPGAVARDRRIPVAPGVPVVFSTDANSATYVASVVPGATNGELFRVEPLPDGTVRVQSPHPRLTVNDEPLDVDRRLKVDMREPIRVRLGPREFNIIGVFGRPRSFERTDDVFDAEALQH